MKENEFSFINENEFWFLLGKLCKKFFAFLYKYEIPAQRSGFPLEQKSILNFDFSEHKAKHYSLQLIYWAFNRADSLRKLLFISFSDLKKHTKKSFKRS